MLYVNLTQIQNAIHFFYTPVQNLTASAAFIRVTDPLFFQLVIQMQNSYDNFEKQFEKLMQIRQKWIDKLNWEGNQIYSGQPR